MLGDGNSAEEIEKVQKATKGPGRGKKGKKNLPDAEDSFSGRGALGEEIEKVQKAPGPGRGIKHFPKREDVLSGRGALGIDGDQKSESRRPSPKLADLGSLVQSRGFCAIWQCCRFAQNMIYGRSVDALLRARERGKAGTAGRPTKDKKHVPRADVVSAYQQSLAAGQGKREGRRGQKEQRSKRSLVRAWDG